MNKSHERLTPSDSELIQLIQNGCNAAFNEFYERHSFNMYLAAHHLLHDEDEAKDAVQELFSDVWQSAHRIDPSGNIKGYLYTVLRNRVLTTIGRSKHLDKYIASYLAFEAKESTSTEDTVLVRDLEQLLEKKVNQLPQKMREIHKLSWEANLSNKEIAERMEITEGTVKQHKHHAIRILRSKLQRLISFIIF